MDDEEMERNARHANVVGRPQRKIQTLSERKEGQQMDGRCEQEGREESIAENPQATSGTPREMSEEEWDEMCCLSCKDSYTASNAGTCRECYEEASEAEEELKKEIEELKAKISFLKTWAPSPLLDRFSDVLLHASEGVPISAHKAVLMSKSPVFKAMLENEMEESKSGTIKIVDVPYDVLRSFIQYLYTADIVLDEPMAFELLIVAEKYQVKHLKSVCEKFITSKVNNDNAMMTFVFAHRHNAKHLLKASLSLITENMHTLTTQDEYKELVDKDPRLVVEIYEAYLAKQVNTAAKKKSLPTS